jgi:serine/threonine protein kinase
MKHKKDGCSYAVKMLNKKRIAKSIDGVIQEKRILQSISHPFVVKLHYAFQDDHFLYLALNYVGGGNLLFHLKQLGRFTNDQILFYGAEIVLTLEYLHSNSILFRDLKLENIMLGMDGHIQLTDFGLAKDFRRLSAKEKAAEEQAQAANAKRSGGGRKRSLLVASNGNNMCGTSLYFAPELILGDSYDVGLDWWTFGVTLYEMLAGDTPFHGKTEQETFDKIVKSSVTFPSNHPSLSVELRSLVSLLLEKNPAKRLGGGEDTSGAAIKAHFFFGDMDWEKLLKKELPPPIVPKREFREIKRVDEEDVDMEDDTLRRRVRHKEEQQLLRQFSNFDWKQQKGRVEDTEGAQDQELEAVEADAKQAAAGGAVGAAVAGSGAAGIGAAGAGATNTAVDGTSSA